MPFLAAHAADLLSFSCAILGAFGGLWAAFFRLRQLLKAEIREYAASKEDVARIEGKIDIVLSALISRRKVRLNESR